MKIGDTHWPTEHLYVVLTPGGAIAKRPGRGGGGLLVFTSYEDACGWLRPGYAVAALDVVRAKVLHVDGADA